MSEQYLFIIWSKARFCEKRIIDDLIANFTIVNIMHVIWDKTKFHDNLLAFYGTKTTNVDEKIKAVGDEEFTVIIVEDTNPIFDNRKTYNGSEIVNTKIYDKKWLYRKWTAGQFRIHSSQSQEETIHDLCILLGPNYQKIIASTPIYSCLTVDVYGNCFIDNDEFSSYVKNIDKNNKVYIDKNNIYIFTQCEKDLVFIFKNSNSIIINNNKYNLAIFGEKEGNLPKGFINVYCDNLIHDFMNIIDDYIIFLHNRDTISDKLKSFYTKYGFIYNSKYIDTMRPYTKDPAIKQLINRIKYPIYRLINLLK